MSIFGVLNGVFQIFFFARINDHWGSKRVFFWGVASGIPVFASFPVINYLARHNGYSTTVWIAVGFQIVISIASGLSFGQYFYFARFRVALPLTLFLLSQALSSFSLSTHRPIGPLSEQPTVYARSVHHLFTPSLLDLPRLADDGQHSASHWTGCGKLVILDYYGQRIPGWIPCILYPPLRCLCLSCHCFPAPSPRWVRLTITHRSTVIRAS